MTWLAPPEQRYLQNRETANVGLVSSVGRAPARQSSGSNPEVAGSNPALVNFSLFIQNLFSNLFITLTFSSSFWRPISTHVYANLKLSRKLFLFWKVKFVGLTFIFLRMLILTAKAQSWIIWVTVQNEMKLSNCVLK